MDKGNKSQEDRTKKEMLPSDDRNGLSKPCEDPFPPKLKGWQWVILIVSWVALLLAALYLVEQFCSRHPLSYLTQHCAFWKEASRPCVWGSYIAFGLLLGTYIIDRIIHYDLDVHKARLEDISEVEALFVEARTVEPPSIGPLSKPEKFDEKKNELLEELTRLRDDVGNRGWTEYQVLSLNQMLVEFLQPEELTSRAQSSLEDLEDYASDIAYGGYDQRQYEKWKHRIDDAIEKLEETHDKLDDKESAFLKLQAELETLLEHVASYNANWSEGSTILGGIRKCGILALFLLLPMGLLPRLHPAIVSPDDQVLSFLNWGLLGIIGAITAVLYSLRKSDYVEVGNTLGKKELWRAIGGTGLGFVAGILAYSMIAGGFFETGHVVPKLTSSSLRDIGLSILWAVGAGLFLENVLDRMFGMTFGAN